MATKAQIEAQIIHRAEKLGATVDWKELALSLLEWQSNVYPAEILPHINRAFRKHPRTPERE